MRQILMDAYDRARQHYPKLLDVYECPPDVYRGERGDLLDIFCKSSTLVTWSTGDSDYVQHGQSGAGNIAGHACMIEREGHQRIAVFLMTDPQLSEPVASAIFAHELGHVDDLSRALHLVPDQPADLSAAEEHAHLYACGFITETARRADHFGKGLSDTELQEWRNTFPEMLRPIMAFYLTEMLPNLAASPVASIAEAAQRVIASPKHAEYIRFVGSYFDENGAVGA